MTCQLNGMYPSRCIYKSNVTGLKLGITFAQLGRAFVSIAELVVDPLMEVGKLDTATLVSMGIVLDVVAVEATINNISSNNSKDELAAYINEMVKLMEMECENNVRLATLLKFSLYRQRIEKLLIHKQ